MSNRTTELQPISYHDRHHAAVVMAGALARYAPQSPLVVAIARGGIPVAVTVAQELGAELDVIVVQKLGVPGHPHVTAGAVSSRGASNINHRALGAFGISPMALDRALDKERLVLQQLEREIRAGHPAKSVTGRLVIVVDDAIITGTTLHVAVTALRQAGARQLVLAAPAGSQSALSTLRAEVADVVCPAPLERLDRLADAYENCDAVSVQYCRQLFEQVEARGHLHPEHADVAITAGNLKLAGTLTIPPDPRGLVVFVHGSGSNRFSPRNGKVARALEGAGFATLLFDLLTAEEQAADSQTQELRNDLALLAERVSSVVEWLAQQPATAGLPIGLFGASTGAAAALSAAVSGSGSINAVVSRGGRPDLAEAILERVRTPTLLLVGSEDHAVLELNRAAAQRLHCPHSTKIVAGATHLFAEPGALEAVAEHAIRFFSAHQPSGDRDKVGRE